MGLMRFLIDADVLGDAHRQQLFRAHISGLDGRIYPTRVEIDGSVLTCRRPHSDSGKLHVPWPVADRGSPVFTTTSLREREQPYHLGLELARGKLSMIRDQCAIWQQLRMVVPEQFHALQGEAFRAFSRASAALDDEPQVSRLARESLTIACQAADLLTESYIDQRLATRPHAAGHAPTLLGCTVDGACLTSAHSSSDVFDAAAVPIRWNVIEPREGQYDWDLVDQLVAHCVDERLIMRAGPLIDLGPGGLPEWLLPWQNDFLNLQSFVCDFIETAVSRYAGRIRLWEVSAHANTGVSMGLEEENRLALAARTLEAASRTDTDAQFFIRIDQPWSEYQARGQHRLSAFQFVDALIRSNIGLQGVNLEIAIGFYPRGTLKRDVMEFSRLLDYWSQLGVQLHVTLAVPSAAGPDPYADPDFDVDPLAANTAWDENAQAQQVKSIVRLLMAKPAVTGIFWSHWHDSEPHQYPHAGLFRNPDTPKPVWDILRQCGREGW